MSQIADLMNILLVPLQAYAASISGQAQIVNDLSHAWYYCQRNENFPLVMLAYTGERMRGDPVTNSIYAHVDLDFSIIVSRNRGLTAVRGMSLTVPTGNALPMYQIVEDVRDVIRGTTGLDEMVEWPPAYKGATQWDTQAFISDAYKIDFSLAVIMSNLGLAPQVTAN